MIPTNFPAPFSFQTAWPRLFTLLLLLAPLQNPAATTEARLLRFPAIHGDRIVFGYAGDLYAVPANGGIARRLTSDPKSYEMFPRFSPDGQHLAFTAQYDGNTEVYVMPSLGGEPRRLTYTATLDRDDVSDRMGPNNIVLTWRDNETIVYRSRRTQWNAFKGDLTLAKLSGGPPEILPLPRGGWCSFSPDGKQLAYNRVFREFRTWKRYRGGQSDDLWLYDFDAKTTVQLTTDGAQDIFPMWKGDRIFFVSERDENRQANLFVLDLHTRQTRQLTRFTEFAVKFPSLGDHAIVFENGGFIWRFDLATEQAAKVPIQIHEDFSIGRGGWRDVSKSIAAFDIAPDGARALLGARGDVFTVPAKHGPTRNLTQSPGTHERDAVWSPDGRWIAYISDATGEDELWLRPQDGSGEATQLTRDGDTYKYAPTWSPNSQHLAWGDKKNRLHILHVPSRAISLAAQSKAWEIRDFTWSPDSQWLAYTQPEIGRFANIYLYSLASQQTIPVTDGWFSVSSPEFSQDGKFLFFVSARSFAPTYGATEWNHVYNDMERLYLVTLAKDAKSPLAPKSDEVKPSEERKPEKPRDEPPDVTAKTNPKTLSSILTDPQFKSLIEALDKSASNRPEPSNPDSPAKPSPAPLTLTSLLNLPEFRSLIAELEKRSAASNANLTSPSADPEKEKESPKKVKVKIDAEGLTSRIAVLPPGASNYRSLASVGSKLFYLKKGKLHFFDFEKEKETEAGDVNGYRISSDGKKMLARIENDFAIIDLPTGKLDVTDKKLSLDSLKVRLDRRAEWNQIYNECWRQMRDFFYATNLHGVDWPAMRRRYEPLLPHVQHRADLTYVIGELIGELNAGHAYVGGGDYPQPERLPLGLLGAKIEPHPSGYFRIAKILPGHNWDPKYRSPLTEIGVNANPGDFILAINGVSAKDMTDPYAALVGTAGKQVALTLNNEPKESGARVETVIPTDNEQPLYYLQWVLGNIEKVEKATDGKIGYVHVPDMGVPGLNEFAKFFYAQLHKQALIVDCRGNGGGNVSPMIIERLRREPAMWTIARNGAVAPDPTGQVLGPKALLIDQHSASDGDIVAYRFRKHQLGPIIGQRSWGGVVGIRGSLPLLDGGTLMRPEFSRFDLEAKEWIMEGVGVEPDIVVDNDPACEFAGEDDQLNRAIQELLKSLAETPVRIPSPPPLPDKRK